jgi:3-hydroxybutyryl-CoA dehydrogenase
MELAVLAGGDAQKEMLAKDTRGACKFTWVDSIEELLKVPGMDGYFDFDFEEDPTRVQALAQLLPKPVVINAVIPTLQSIGYPFIRINAWPTFFSRPVLEIALREASDQEIANSIFDPLGWSFKVVPDTAGMVSARIVSMIINEAFYALEERVSSKDNIDLAMKLGTNYPLGPFEWSRLIGLPNIYSLLKTLEKTDDRYTVSSLLEEECLGRKIQNKN